jgi:hypothetical protein
MRMYPSHHRPLPRRMLHAFLVGILGLGMIPAGGVHSVHGAPGYASPPGIGEAQSDPHARGHHDSGPHEHDQGHPHELAHRHGDTHASPTDVEALTSKAPAPGAVRDTGPAAGHDQHTAHHEGSPCPMGPCGADAAGCAAAFGLPSRPSLPGAGIRVWRGDEVAPAVRLGPWREAPFQPPRGIGGSSVMSGTHPITLPQVCLRSV